ncbi:hypothetical protein LSH36_307g02050 [Paralvinella palmiformis]|uniref:C2H2-type domain-containing protein n=1 Tax=Paralvinella palmiformis TaxID=53620 RepID=A0AAD9JHJ1_9ANNE|nr:hypothetical protein LSH36_307g02050 [Paralvinella palmiformis]
MDIRKLEVMLPCKLVDCLTGMKQCQQVQLSGRTIADHNIVIDIEQKMEDGFRLLLSGDSGFISLIKDTYKCQISSVSDVTTDEVKLSASTVEDDTNPIDNLEKVNHEQDYVLMNNIRRSARSKVRNQDSIVKRLHLVGKRRRSEKHPRTVSLLNCTRKLKKGGRPKKILKAECETETDLDKGLAVTKINIGSRAEGNDIQKSANIDIVEGELPSRNEAVDDQKLDDTPLHLGEDRLSSGPSQHKSDGETVGMMKNCHSTVRRLFLATRNRHLLSDSTREKLEKLAFKCPCCKYAALNVATFKYHLQAHHKLTWKDYKSKFASEVTESEVGEKLSVSKTGSSQEILRDFCRQKQKVTKHRKIYDRDKEKNRFVCELCGLKYRMKGSLMLHLRTKHSGDEQLSHVLRQLQNNSCGRRSEMQTECPFCKDICSGQRIFTHMKLSHVGEQDFFIVYRTVEKQYYQQMYQRSRDETTSEKSCPHCSTELKKCSLKRHIENHCRMNSSRQQRYHCHLCHYYSTDRSVLSQHKATAHKDRPKYICETCGACYRTPVGLRQHSRIKHQRVWKKPLQWWTCQDCSKQFSSRLNLERHKPVHTREYQHICSFCGKKFKDPSSLLTHRRNIHQGHYRYTCEKCGHGMERKSYLKRHKCENIRRHTDTEISLSEPTKTEQAIVVHPSQDRSEIYINDTEVLQNTFSQMERSELRLLQNEANLMSNGEAENNDQKRKNVVIHHTQDDLSENILHNDRHSQLTQSEILEGKCLEVGCSSMEQTLVDQGKNEPDVSCSCNKADIDSTGADFQKALCEGVTFIVHASEDQVATAISTLDGLQVQDGSVIIMETEVANDLLITSGTSMSISDQHVVGLNATLSDGSTVFLVPSSNSIPEQEKSSTKTKMPLL